MSLVDPTAESWSAHAVARRPGDLDGAVIGLVDGMLNPDADWGQGLLDEAQDRLLQRFPGATLERVSRQQLAPSQPDMWAETMAKRYAALVIAAGD